MAQRPVAQRPYFAYSGAYLCAYLGTPNMVEWGVPEKILQNAVETRWSRSNVMTKSHFFAGLSH